MDFSTESEATLGPHFQVKDVLSEEQPASPGNARVMACGQLSLVSELRPAHPLSSDQHKAHTVKLGAGVQETMGVG